jgi:hypothetical protein
MEEGLFYNPHEQLKVLQQLDEVYWYKSAGESKQERRRRR